MKTYPETSTKRNNMNEQGIEAKIRKEDKSGLGYIIGKLNHNDPAALYYDSYKKAQLLERVLNYRDLWRKLKDFQTYKEFFN